MSAHRLCRHFFRLLAIILFYLELSHCWRNYDMDFTDYRYETLDNETMKQLFFELHQFEHRMVVSGSMTFARNVSIFDIELSVTITRPNGDSFKLLDLLFDGCKTLETALSKSTNLVKIVVNEIKRSVLEYFPDRCPIQKDRPIIIQNLHINPDLFPPFMPECSYIAKFNFVTKGKYVFKAFFNGSVIMKDKKKDKAKRKGRKNSTSLIAM